MSWLIVTGRAPLSALAQQWRDAIEPVRIEHPNLESKVLAKLVDEGPPRLTLYLDRTRDTVDGRRRDNFQISTVRLAYFPGVRLARMWLAAAWTGYVQHEALELVTVDGQRPIDPHLEIDGRYPFDRGLRSGLPGMLTRETLIQTLCVVMPEDEALRVVAG